MYGPNMDLVQPSPREKDTLLKKFDIPVHHLDFAYVENCKNGGELEKMVQVLRSGEEGHFPELTRAVLERLRVVKPGSKYAREVDNVLHRNGLSKEEKTQLNGELSGWLRNVGRCEEDLKERRREGNVLMPKVRSAKGALKQAAKEAKRIKSTDYSAWDKYDPDAELLKIDMEAEMLKKESEKGAKPDVQKGKFPTKVEAELAANREREKGNEFYRAADYELALIHYTNCINYAPTIAGYNNRAITNYKLQKYKEAAADCAQALKLDPNNIKANLRAALSYRALKNTRKALYHAEQVIKVDPNNSEAQKLIGTLNVSVAKVKTRMKIEEVDNDKVLLAIPGPSNMPEPYYVAVENKDKAVLKRQEYVLNNRRQTLRFRNLKPSCDDEDCVEVHGNHRNTNCASSLSPLEVGLIQKDGNSGENAVVFNDEVVESSPEVGNNSREETNLIADKNEDAIGQVSSMALQNEVAAPNLDTEHVAQGTSESLEALHLHKEHNNNVKVKRNQSKRTENGNSNARHVSLLENHVRVMQNIADLDEINTPYGFLKSWRSARNDGLRRAEILRRLDCNRLHEVISNKLDGTMLGDILTTLRKHFVATNEADRVRSILIGLTVVPRFNVVVMLLTNEDKMFVRCLLKFVEENGKAVDDNIKLLYS